MHLYRQFDDDVRLCKRTTIGVFVGLAAALAWALGYASLYGTNDLPMAAFLARWSLALGAPFVIGGILCGAAIHLLRERAPKGRP
ncbi:hypothetical protein [Paludisphaera mucosa]|uniref:Uncharacterized protein n=1 Tax=Paludisphaera mucosa TaxID=3030827 RepID=A0ABT6FCB1_9BACT|nr:hypothetical protein [Paludisphaera mucosa]MDG3005038.1 hypothetical protein [Paludisphaera mucosa]